MEKVTRKTKIVATLGPASDKEHVLEKMIEKGVNVVRINMSHGTKEEQQNRILKTRDIAKKLKVEVGVLVDLQGPKIRISKFKEKMVVLKEGNKFILDANLEDNAGDENQVGIDYKNLVNDVRIGDEILLDDGRLSLDARPVGAHSGKWFRQGAAFPGG